MMGEAGYYFTNLVSYCDSSVLHRTSLLHTIFALLAHRHDQVHIHNLRDFPQAELNSEFLSNKYHCDIQLLIFL